MIVPTDVPMTSRLASMTVLELALRYSLVRSRLLTVSPGGRPVRMLKIGQGERKLIFSAAHHANEWITATLLLAMTEQYLAAISAGETLFGQDARELFQRNTLYIVPMMDPDGVDLVTGAIRPGSAEYDRALEIAEGFPQIPFPQGWKADLQGIDLNLSYPAGWLQAREIKFAQGFDRPAPRDYVGPWPLFSPEPRALFDLTLAVEPELVIAWHTQGEVIYWQFQDIEVPGARELAQTFSDASGYSLEDIPYGSSFAGYKDWFIQRFTRPGFTVEAGLGENPLPLEQLPRMLEQNIGIFISALVG